MSTPLVSLRDVSLALGGQSVLQNVDLDISPGEIVTVVGPNGSGKSSLLRIVIGALTPDRGQVNRVRRLRIGYVPQTLSVDSTLPIHVSRFMSLPFRRSRSAIAQALDRAGIVHLADRPLAELSGGQFQRVLLARAVLGSPGLLILDEPTNGLDQPGAAALYNRIAELRDRLGCAVLLVSHDLHVVMSASDRVICLNGHVCCHGTPEVVTSAPEYRALFGSGTGGALALYKHEHDHSHGGSPEIREALDGS